MKGFLSKGREDAAQNLRALCQTAVAVLLSLLMLIICFVFSPNHITPRITDKPIKSGDGIQFALANENKYKATGYGGASDGKDMKYREQIDFNLHCSGRPDIKRVTYTARNCKFLKKSFFTKEQADSGEADQYTEGYLWGQTMKDGSEVSWGFEPIGTVYSADFLEEANLTNFGLELEFTEKNYRRSVNSSDLAGHRGQINELRKEAYDKASVLAEIELEDGQILRKTIKIEPKTDSGKVAIQVADTSQNTGNMYIH